MGRTTIVASVVVLVVVVRLIVVIVAINCCQGAIQRGKVVAVTFEKGIIAAIVNTRTSDGCQDGVTVARRDGSARSCAVVLLHGLFLVPRTKVG